MKNFRFGKTKESQRIKEKKSNFSNLDVSLNKPGDFNKDCYGSINYDPILGWTGIKHLGKDSELSFTNEYSTQHLNRKDGLPGSR